MHKEMMADVFIDLQIFTVYLSPSLSPSRALSLSLSLSASAYRVCIYIHRRIICAGEYTMHACLYMSVQQIIYLEITRDNCHVCGYVPTKMVRMLAPTSPPATASLGGLQNASQQVL